MFSSKKRVSVFVDGENLRHSIVELFPEPVFHEYDYLPKTANWGKFFDWISNEAVGSEAERIRTYWYVVQNLDCSPFNLDSVRKDRGTLEQLFLKYPIRRSIFDASATRQIKDALLDKWADEFQAVQDTMESRFDGWTRMQNEIAKQQKAVEFRRAGAIRYDLMTKKLGSEKAVDVKLATDLLKLKDIYDVAVIVSGDQDYVPAVDSIKDFGKHVVNVSFLKDDGKLLPGGAQRLNHVTDWSIEIKHADLKSHLGL